MPFRVNQESRDRCCVQLWVVRVAVSASFLLLLSSTDRRPRVPWRTQFKTLGYPVYDGTAVPPHPRPQACRIPSVLGFSTAGNMTTTWTLSFGSLRHPKNCILPRLVRESRQMGERPNFVNTRYAGLQLRHAWAQFVISSSCAVSWCLHVSSKVS